MIKIFKTLLTCPQSLWVTLTFVTVAQHDCTDKKVFSFRLRLLFVHYNFIFKSNLSFVFNSHAEFLLVCDLCDWKPHKVASLVHSPGQEGSAAGD